MSAAAATSETGIRRRVVAAGISGNVLEWYDFAVYGYFAPIIAERFFPSDSPTASLLAAYGAFAAGFLMRPLGGFLFGHLGDRLGRRVTLILSVALMAGPTFLIGVLPDHADIGVAAAILMILMRMLQGLAVGGEYTTSVIYLVEQAPPDRRGYYGSWSLFGCIGGILLGSAVGAVIHTIWAAEVHDWAWRVPFLAGLAVGLTGFILRRGLPESLTDKDKETHKLPLAKAVREEGGAMARVIGISVVNAVAFYMIFIYITVFLERQVGLPAATALDVNTLSMIAMLVMIPLFARLSDRIGRKPLLVGAAFGLLLLSYPLLWVMHHADVTTIFLGQLGFSVLVGCYLAVQPTAMAEMFSPGVRCSGMAVAYNITLGLVGGTTPMVCTYLIEKTGDDLFIAWYLMAAAAISLAVALTLKETAKAPLRSS
ncbi:MAG: MFS transporter [Alphaproteobacteria bacterium]|nr:MFS transporter [Alphaproteobacteria bacterium]